MSSTIKYEELLKTMTRREAINLLNEYNKALELCVKREMRRASLAAWQDAYAKHNKLYNNLLDELTSPRLPLTPNPIND